MNSVEKSKILKEELEKSNGWFRLAPAWVPRSFCIPGRRLKLHPEDYYALGANRGGIDERWLASTTYADNGPLTSKDEGLSYIVVEKDGEQIKFTLKEAIEELIGEDVLGKECFEKYGKWMMYSKFFDNMGALPHHVHQMDEHANLIGKLGKPEAYYFPPQQNNILNDFPHTYFGLNPDTKKEEVLKCIENWNDEDNNILSLSRAYKLQPGTGWDVPPGILHAPGSLCTYEPQRASDVFGHFQNIVDGLFIDRDLLVKDVPEDKKFDNEYLINMLDWEKNVDPNFYENRFCPPINVEEESEMKSKGYIEKWVVYGSRHFSAKELTVLPGETVVIKDDGAYGFIVMQGHGKFNDRTIESPVMIRFGSMTQDEGFVTFGAAKDGVTITNSSKLDDLVLLKHFGPDNKDSAKFIKKQ